MFKDFFRKKKRKGLGLNLKAGDSHYRAYVGPPQFYDIVSAMVFNLLTCLGLRQEHKVLDIGCGSLRVGRLFIPYLNTGNYFAVEPNRWLVEDGIENEIGQDLIRIKKPTFSYNTSLEEFKTRQNFDFAIAQSIFSHCGVSLISEWLQQVSFHLNDNGALLATFVKGDENAQDGWHYPHCVSFQPEVMSEIASESGLGFTVLDWKHPANQTWGIFTKPNYDRRYIENEIISWNTGFSDKLRDAHKRVL